MNDDLTVEQRRQKYQEQANKTGKEVWWRGEQFLPQVELPGPLPEGSACPFCGKALEATTNISCGHCKASFVPLAKVEAPSPPPGAKEYKVLTQRDEWFGGNFSSRALEDAINYLAREGWRVVSMAAADVGSWLGTFKPGGGRQEIVILLERDLK